MRERTFALHPVDAWFFRDGRPYHHSESSQAWVESVFPPFSTTLVGALRLGLAHGQGFSGRGTWSKAIAAVLGDGPHDLGRLSFVGPRMQWRGQDLFPLPRHVLGSGAPALEHAAADVPGWQARALLAPADDDALVACDLEGEDGRPAVLPRPVRIHAEGDRISHRDDVWLTHTGLEKVLRGVFPAPEDLVPADALWRIEPRVGLEREWPSRTAKEGALYSPGYVRLMPGVRLAMKIRQLPEDWSMPSCIALGGESRMAYCDPVADSLALPACPSELIRRTGRVAVILLGHACLVSPEDPQPAWPMPGDALPGMAGMRVVSACIGRPVPIGGWDGLRREPLPLLPFVPAGSVWFCEADSKASIDTLLEYHGDCIGSRTEYGFGQIALGVWPERGEQ